MGLRSLTRYYLYNISGDYLKENGTIAYRNPKVVMNMYYDSATLIEDFENMMISDNANQNTNFLKVFEQNIGKIDNAMFVQAITYLFQKQIDKNNNKQSTDISFETYFRYLLNAITIYQEQIINDNFLSFSFDEMYYKKRKQTFLSYAYDDKGLTQALFYYFWVNSGFLYVDWMWNGAFNSGSLIKENLENALEDSEQFLFLRTTNSELKVRGNHTIRQWCAWEIGNFYTKHKDQKFYTSFYDKTKPNNVILDTFKPMEKVELGEIRW